MKKILVYLSFLMIPVFPAISQNWQEIRSVDQVCAAYPDKMEYILQQINLNYPGLEKVKRAWEKKELAKACSLLLDYYQGRYREEILAEDKNSSTNFHFYQNKKQTELNKPFTSADSVLNDIYTFQNVSGKVPRLPDGHLTWSYNGPEDDIEWAWALNRHYPVNELFLAYTQTGKPEYAEYIDFFIRDWIIQSWPYPAKKSSTAMWRGLEVSFRVKMWARVFFELMNSGHITQATRLLILSSLPDHAHYARNFHAQNNWLTMEISGLATVAAYWPEFSQSAEWLDYGMQTMTASMKEQVYPDGSQTELTSSYHFVALDNFNQFLKICKKARTSLPEYFTQTIEDMWNYLALTIRPDGNGLLNNDADLMNNRERLLIAAEEYGRDDWKYVVTGGSQGTKPDLGPSFVFPWAGHLISRSGYEPDAHWSFFDMGPWGSGHQHNDKMHLSVSAFGRDLLVDGGRFAYRGEVAQKFRKYATGSFSHNVLVIDDKGQGPGPALANEPILRKNYLITAESDMGRASFSHFPGIDGYCKHTRTIFYARGDLWVVIDQIATDKPRQIKALWHWHPECNVIADDQNVSTANDMGNLQIIPAGDLNWDVTIVKGQESPQIQGWYSKEYNILEPNPTAIYHTAVKKNHTFAWILYPSQHIEKPVIAEILHQSAEEIRLKITNQDNDIWMVTIPLDKEALESVAN